MAAPNIEGTLNIDVLSGGVNNGTTVGASALTPAGMHGSYTVQPTGYGTPTGNALTADFPGATANVLVTAETLSQLIVDLKAKGILGA